MKAPYRPASFPSSSVREQTGRYMDPTMYDDIGDVMQNGGDEYVDDDQYYQKPYRNSYPDDDNYPRYASRSRMKTRPQPQRTLDTIPNMRRRRITRNISSKDSFKRDILRLFKAKNIRNLFSKNFKNIHRKRKRRHIGPHDEDGLQRLLSTGTLAPTTLPRNHPDFNHSIDFLFATYWFFPAKTQVILPSDKKCIDEKMAKEKIRFSPTSKFLH